MTELDIAWAAGFFDGEGCIVLHSNGSSPVLRLRLDVGQVDRRPLEKLVAIFGGSIQAVPFRSERWRRQYVWRLTSPDSSLAAMLPYLTVKKEQAELALEFAEKRKALVRNGVTTPPDVVAELNSYREKLSALKRA